MIFNRMS